MNEGNGWYCMHTPQLPLTGENPRRQGKFTESKEGDVGDEGNGVEIVECWNVVPEFPVCPDATTEVVSELSACPDMTMEFCLISHGGIQFHQICPGVFNSAVVVISSACSNVVAFNFTKVVFRTVMGIFSPVYAAVDVICSTVGIYSALCYVLVVFCSAMGIFSPVSSAVVVFCSAVGIFSSICSTMVVICSAVVAVSSAEIVFSPVSSALASCPACSALASCTNSIFTPSSTQRTWPSILPPGSASAPPPFFYML
ncbi:unnamed protein product [Leuciscus chuanchicus]